jgi:hypothetical protein
MDFIKKHYEKILLGVMLLGLIGVLIFMLFYIAAEKSNMESKSGSLINSRAKALTNLDTTVQDGAMQRVKTPFELDFETTNKLLNPMAWQRALDGTLIPVRKTGVQVAVVTNISPLYLIISLESIVKNDVSTNYVIKVERQNAPTAAKRQPARHYIALNEKPNDVFALEAVKGPAEDPTGLVLKLVDTGDEVTISKDNPYRRVDGHSADFRYDPEKRAFHGIRVGAKVSFGGVDYTVVEINQNELILMDQSNQKKTSLPFTP